MLNAFQAHAVEYLVVGGYAVEKDLMDLIALGERP
jgi:hypothetical protein